MFVCIIIIIIKRVVKTTTTMQSAQIAVHGEKAQINQNIVKINSITYVNRNESVPRRYNSKINTVAAS